MEQVPSHPTSAQAAALNQLLAILLPLFLAGTFFSFHLESRAYPSPAPHPASLDVFAGIQGSLAPTTNEEYLYVQQVRAAVESYVETLARIGPLYERVQKDRALLSDRVWRAELQGLITDLQRMSEEAKNYPAPARYSLFHDKFSRVAQRYLLAGELYEEGLSDQNDETLLLADEAYSRANAGLAELMSNDLSLMR